MCFLDLALGLFCVHLLRAFMHEQLPKIPSKYVLQRYTRNARNDVPFDRCDLKLKGLDGETKMERHNKVMSKSMTLVRVATLSKAALEKSLDGLDDLIKLVEKLPADIVDGDIDLSDDEVRILCTSRLHLTLFLCTGL